MNTIKMQVTLYSLFLIVLLLTQAVFGTYFVFKAKTLSQTAEQLHYSTSLVTEISEQVQGLRRFEKEYIIYVTQPEKRDHYFKQWQDSYNDIKKMIILITENPKHVWNDDKIKQARKWDDALNEYGRSFISISARVNDGVISDSITANQAIFDGKNRLKILVDGAAQLCDVMQQGEGHMHLMMRKKFNLALIFVASTAFVGIMLALIFGFTFPQSLTSPIVHLSKVADKMSKGALNAPIKVERGAKEVRDLAATLERLRIAQRGLLLRLRKSSQKTEK